MLLHLSFGKTIELDVLFGLPAAGRWIVYDTPLTIERNLTLLGETPSRLDKITKGLSRLQLATAPEPGEWSARDVLAHLRACSDMWGKYIAMILSEDHPTFKAMNPTTWIKQTDYREQAFGQSLWAFTTQRLELLALLKPLPAEAWSRAATAITAGRPRQRTVQTYAMWLANHERSHFKQLERIAEALRRQPARGDGLLKVMKFDGNQPSSPLQGAPQGC